MAQNSFKRLLQRDKPVFVVPQQLVSKVLAAHIAFSSVHILSVVPPISNHLPSVVCCFLGVLLQQYLFFVS